MTSSLTPPLINGLDNLHFIHEVFKTGAPSRDAGVPFQSFVIILYLTFFSAFFETSLFTPLNIIYHLSISSRSLFHVFVSSASCLAILARSSASIFLPYTEANSGRDTFLVLYNQCSPSHLVFTHRYS